jgi:hypothetical protein
MEKQDQITWNAIPESEQKNTLNNQTLNNRTKARNQTKENRTNKSLIIKLTINNTGAEWLSVLRKG